MASEFSESSAQTRHKRALKINYSHPGAVPPVFVATSLTSPPWQPHEMQYSSLENSSELEFYKEFYDVEAGDYHYKFRLGYGEWWVLNESAPKVTDDAGNLNNLLNVSAELDHNEPEQIASRSASDHQITEEASRELEGTLGLETTPVTNELGIPITTLETTEAQPERTSDAMDDKYSEHKAAISQAGAEADAISWPDRTDLPNVVVDKNDNDRDVEAQAPIIGELDNIRINGDDSSAAMGGAQAVSRQTDEADRTTEVTVKSEQGTLYTNGTAASARTHVDETNAQAGETTDMLDEPIVQIQPTSHENPFPHSVAVDAHSGVMLDKPKTLADLNPLFATALGYQTPDSGSPRIEHAPLFSHEILASLPEDAVAGRRQPVKKPASTLREVQMADDFNQPNLELFPTDRAQILETIQATEERLKEDETRADGSPPSPVVPSKRSPELGMETSVSRERSGSNISLESSPKQLGLEAIPEFGSDTTQVVQADDSAQSAASPAAAEQPTEPIGSAAVEPTKLLTSSSPLTPPLTPKTPNALLIETGTKTDPPAETNPPVEESTSADMSKASPQPSSDTDTAQPTNPPVEESTLAPISAKASPQPSSAIDTDTAHPELWNPNLRKRNLASSSNVDPASPASPASPDKDEQRHEGILMSIWRTLFGSWLAPLMHLFGGLVGGRAKAE